MEKFLENNLICYSVYIIGNAIIYTVKNYNIYEVIPYILFISCIPIS